MWKDLVDLLTRLDAWVNRIQIHFPKFLRVNEKDISLASRILLRLGKFTMFLAVAAGLLWVVYWFTFRGPVPGLADPSQQHILPTLEPTATGIPNTNPWQSEEWMSQSDAGLLRTQENVINLAYLEGGGVKYSRFHGIAFTPGLPWQETKPLGMSALSVQNTAVFFTLNGEQYALNTYEPFVDGANPAYVYIIDIQGRTWRANASEIREIGLKDAVAMLPLVVNPNPSLSFTY